MGGVFGSKAPTVTEAAVAPPPAPASEDAMLEEFTDEDIDKKKKKAKTEGAASLQIPLGGASADLIGKV